MGRPTHRRSIRVENAVSASMKRSLDFQGMGGFGGGGGGTPPCVLAMISKVERAMQRALIDLSHVPWMGIHATRMIVKVAVLMTVKKAMRRYVYL